MPKPVPWSEVAVATLLAVALGWLYWTAPVTQLADSRYSMLATHAALHHQTLLLDRYDLPYELHPGPDGVPTPHYRYQVDNVNGHVVSHYPPASPLLSVPFLLWRESEHETVVTPDGHYAPWQDERLQHELAAIVTAATALLLWWLARTWLTAEWSLLVAAVAGLGSPLLSTTSRALWSHTWGVFVLSLLLLQLRRLSQQKAVSAVWLGTLAAWLYLIRPSFSLAVAATGLYLLDHLRRTTPTPWPKLLLQPLSLRFGVTVLAWLTPFWLWSQSVWGHPLPPYYRHPLGNPEFLQALAANLVSPARGLLLYCAWLLPTAWLLLRYRRHVPMPQLTVWAAGYLAVQWLLISLNPMWTGGGSYGPRLMTDLVPVMALLLAQGLAAWRAAPDRDRATPVTLTATTLLAVALHVNGAWNLETWRWGTLPTTEPETARMWSWQRAEFLAGLWQPVAAYTPGTRIDFTEKGNVVPYLLHGWANPEANGTWTMAKEAALLLSLPPVAQPRTLEVAMSAFLGRSNKPQPVEVRINGVLLGEWQVAREGRFTMTVPEDIAQQPEWRVSLTVGRPQRPDAIGFGPDWRDLGVSVAWLEIR